MYTVNVINIEEVDELKYMTHGNDGQAMAQIGEGENVLKIFAPVEFWIECARGARSVREAGLAAKEDVT